MKEYDENSDSVFDRVLHSVGDDGKFQRRYNWIFNFGLCLTGTMVYINIVMALTIPDHWCSVPGRENTNMTIEEWKSITLPREIDSSGLNSSSSCKMFNRTYNDNEADINITNYKGIISCQYGYDYDEQWYTSTVPTTQDWVCEKELYVSNIFAAAKIGEVIGGLIFGHFGDVIGRRPVLIAAMGLSIVTRLASVLVVDYYVLFLIASVLANMPSTTAPQAGQVILMEISPMEDRAYIAQYQNLGWTGGVCMVPLIYWIFRDWKYYMIFSTVPLMLYIPICFFLIESPRWLLSRGRVAECVKQLRRISKVNGTKLSPDVSMMLHNISLKPEKTYGLCSLFSNWRLAKNTMLLTITWVTTLLCYNTITLTVTSLSGNPFLNFFMQSAAEVPSYLLGKIACERIGRRLSAGVAYFIGVISIASIILITDDPSLGWLQVGLTVIAKFSISMAYFSMSLQSLEIYPTCIRQTGFTFGLMSGNTFSVLSPYIVYLGVTYNARFPYLLLSLLCVLGLVAEVLLPETLNEKLPETIQEAKTFGKHQNYWSVPSKRSETNLMANMKNLENVDQHSDAEN